MDALSHLLYEVRSDGALFGRNILTPPWTIGFAGGAPLTLLTMVHGDGWIVVSGGEPVRLGPLDVAIVVGPEPFSVTGDPDLDTPQRYVIHGSDMCADANGDPVEVPVLGTRTCGDDIDAPVVMLTATYQVRGRVSDRLLTALPRVVLLPNEGRPCPLLNMTIAEVQRDAPGQQAVLDRLLDLLLLSTLREWFDMPGTPTPAWYAALGDPLVGNALRTLHDEPGRPWTVAALAELAGVSRATFARRFRELLGEPPMGYLACWRLALASDLLQRTDDTVDAVARQVGYANAYALSAAFKRHYGTRPSTHRTARVAA